VHVVRPSPRSLNPRERYPAACVPPNRSGWVRGGGGGIFSLPNLHSESKCKRVSQMKTLNMFYLVIYWTQKFHNVFIFLCSIVLPPVGHSSNHEYHCWILQDNRAVVRIIMALLRFSFDSPSYFDAFIGFVLSEIHVQSQKWNHLCQLWVGCWDYIYWEKFLLVFCYLQGP